MVSTQTDLAHGSGTGPTPEVPVGEVMRPATTTVERAAHLAGAAYLMKHRGDTALVVTTDDGDRRPLAVITDADISQAVADGKALEYTRISDVALAPPVTVECSTPARDAARLMLSRRLPELPVVAEGRLVGIVGISDVCRVLMEAPAIA
jgi:CBS domain-containing protein